MSSYRRKRESDNIKIDEVCLLTNDVQRHADFYKQILETENNSSDETHQFILAEGTALTI